jgi:hypothetical protein
MRKDSNPKEWPQVAYHFASCRSHNTSYLHSYIDSCIETFLFLIKYMIFFIKYFLMFQTKGNCAFWDIGKFSELPIQKCMGSGCHGRRTLMQVFMGSGAAMPHIFPKIAQRCYYLLFSQVLINISQITMQLNTLENSQ